MAAGIWSAIASLVLSLDLLFAGLGWPVAAQAQGVAVPREENVVSPSRERTYGTKDIVSHTISAWAFTGFDAANSARFAATNQASRYCAGASCFYEAPVLLPQGVEVVNLGLEACDKSSTGAVTAHLLQKPSGTNMGQEGVFVSLGSASTGTPDTPLCFVFSFTFPAPHPVIDNTENSYFVQVGITGTDDATSFSHVRVWYRLRVSPPPGVATFNDVPTDHQFFPFVEALAAAGITGGCSTSPPLYCPDNPVTRGQMAAFLSRALGLHFPF